MTIQLKRLYYEDSYLESFESSVVDIRPEKNNWAVELNRSAFYPTSGGQPHDEGYIQSHPVIDVYIDDEGRVIHVIEGESETNTPALHVGQAVSGRVTWKRRRDHMQHHTGQHILSACFEQLFDADTIGFHLGTEDVTVDVDNSDLDAEQIKAVEDKANEVIASNLTVAARFVDNTDVSHFRLRRPPKVSSNIRIVSIGDFDNNACGGTHVQSTAEVGLLKILKTERMKKGLRIHFLCGTRAIQHYQQEHTLLTRLGNTLSAGIDDIPDAVEALQTDLKTVRKSEKLLRRETAKLYALQLAALAKMCSSGLYCVASHINGPYGGTDVKTIASAALMELEETAQGKESIAGTAVAIVVQQVQKVHIAIVSSAHASVHCGDVLRSVLFSYGGKGGGSRCSAQGSILNAKEVSMDNLAEQLEMAMCQC